MCHKHIGIAALSDQAEILQGLPVVCRYQQLLSRDRTAGDGKATAESDDLFSKHDAEGTRSTSAQSCPLIMDMIVHLCIICNGNTASRETGHAYLRSSACQQQHCEFANLQDDIVDLTLRQEMNACVDSANLMDS